MSIFKRLNLFGKSKQADTNSTSVSDLKFISYRYAGREYGVPVNPESLSITDLSQLQDMWNTELKCSSLVPKLQHLFNVDPFLLKEAAKSSTMCKILVHASDTSLVEANGANVLPLAINCECSSNNINIKYKDRVILDIDYDRDLVSYEIKTFIPGPWIDEVDRFIRLYDVYIDAELSPAAPVQSIPASIGL